jgi:hypothetical protein
MKTKLIKSLVSDKDATGFSALKDGFTYLFSQELGAVFNREYKYLRVST